MKLFVTGVGGQLGYDVVNELKIRGYEVIGSDIKAETVCDCQYVQLDITDDSQVKDTLFKIKPDAVIHCAAWTAVDAAEEAENIPLVRKINVDGTSNLAKVCKELDCKMMYISTDYVFDGQGDTPWTPDCQQYAPLNVYGQTKLDGELALREVLDKYFIVRIAWVFGANGGNFVKTMLRIGKDREELRVVNDQIGTPTYTFDLAKLLCDMIVTNKYGVYHATNEGGYISWYDFACEIFRLAGYSVKVKPVTTAEYGISKAKRPFNSRLEKAKLDEEGFNRLPTWQDALARYINIVKV